MPYPSIITRRKQSVSNFWSNIKSMELMKGIYTTHCLTTQNHVSCGLTAPWMLNPRLAINLVM